jgi:membrane protein YqaA with SNARE-associated domain
MDHLILGTFAGCVVGGVLPWINTEVILTGAALLAAPNDIAALVLAAAAGQTFAKSAVYALARWAPHLLHRKARAFLVRGRSLGRRRRAVPLTLLVSSAVGFPPFFLTTLAAGALRVPFVVFASAGLAGAAIRYATLAYGAVLVTGGLGVGPS